MAPTPCPFVCAVSCACFLIIGRAATNHEYGPLVREIVKFFQTGNPPVAPEETLEIIAFMDAAQRSKSAGGQPMRLR